MLGTLRVTYTDGNTVEGESRPVDAIRFERQFNKPVSEAFGDNGMRLEYLWYFGFEVVKREQPNDPGTFDQWIEQVQSVEVVESSKSRPTRPGRGRSA